MLGAFTHPMLHNKKVSQANRMPKQVQLLWREEDLEKNKQTVEMLPNDATGE